MLPTYLPQHFRQSFADAFKAAIGQDNPDFVNFGEVDASWPETGTHSWTVIPRLQLQETTGSRGGQTATTQMQGAKRSGFSREFQGGILIPRKDQQRLKEADHIDSWAVKMLKAAWIPEADKILITAALEDALGGDVAPWTTRLAKPSWMTLPVNFQRTAASGSNTGCTVWKLEAMLTTLKNKRARIPRGEGFIAVTPNQVLTWSAYTQGSTNDAFANIVNEYKKNPANGLFGMDVIETPLLEEFAVGGNVPFLVGSKKAFRVNTPTVDIKMDILPKEQHALQIAFYGEWGCAREFDELVQISYADPAGNMLATSAGLN